MPDLAVPAPTKAETLRFPLSMTPARSDTDKKGEPCTTFDCCLNMDVIKQVLWQAHASTLL